MAYTKQTWHDLPSKDTPINASRLGHIEDGIYDAAATADNAAAAIGNLKTAAYKDSTNAVTQASTDLVESGAVYAAVHAVAQDLSDTNLAVAALQTASMNLGKYKAEADSIAPVELDATGASQAYAVDEQFYLNNILMTATSPISQNDAIVVYPTSGYNCKPSDSITEQIATKADKSSLGTASAKNSTSVVTDSTDLVESGAVKDIVGWGNKNLLPNNASSTTINGITFTVNNDGSVTANGIATANAQFIIYLPSNLSGNYLFSSGLQPAGSETTYDASVWDYTSNARTKKWDGTTNSNLSFDSSFNETKIVAEHSTALIWRVRSGKTINNVVLKPMICRATETDTTYEPYHASVEETLRDAEVVEGKNLLPMTLKGIQSANTAGVWSGNSYNNAGITFTINTDSNGNVVDIAGSGTASSNAELNLVPNNTFYLPKDSYILSGGVSNNARIFYYNGTSYYNSKTEEVNFDVSGNETVARYTIVVVSGTTVNNAVFKPMIRKATETDPTYEPYYIPLKDVVPTKADNSVIANVEDGATSGHLYAAGEHFIRNGKLCTVILPISLGGTLTLNTNYTEGNLDSVIKKVNQINRSTNKSATNNSIYVKKDITQYYLDGSLWDRIAGTNGFEEFEDIYPGEYFDCGTAVKAPGSSEEGTSQILICGLNMHRNNNQAVRYNHITCCPVTHFGKGQMNTSNTTVGGYLSSKMHTTILGSVASSGNANGTINQQLYAIFGSHLKTIKELLTNSINANGMNRFGNTEGDLGCSNNWTWADVQSVLFSEIEAYGSIVWSSSGRDTGTAKKQMPAFRESVADLVPDGIYWWLKDVVTAARFCIVSHTGYADHSAASASIFVRPRFVIA